MRALLLIAGLSAACALLAAGCGTDAGPLAKPPTAAKGPKKARCAYPVGWRRLANRIAAPVYCPGWLPDPLTSQIGGKWSNIDSVSKELKKVIAYVFTWE